MEFKVGEHTYRSRRMDARTQFKIAKKIAPLIGAGFAEAMEILEDVKRIGPGAFFALPFKEIATKLAPPLLDAFSKIADDDLDYIIATCLSLCERYVGPQAPWAPVWIAQAGRSAFEDVDFSMPTQLQLVWSILREPMLSFFTAAPSSSNGGASPHTTSPSA